jgi:basic amino acid/polyamine antiporter, APA family
MGFDRLGCGWNTLSTGALAYAELGILFPKAGGEYVYMREAYGDLAGFLWGWQRFWVSSPGSIAAYAVGAATFAAPLLDLGILGGKTGLAIVFILVFTFINCLQVSFGARVNAFMTFLKIFLILFIALGIFAFSKTGSFEHLNVISDKEFSVSAFGAAMLAALWAYDGWNNMPMIAGEVKNPSRNIPLALLLGVGTILVIYLVTNLAYFYALPFAQVLTANSKFNPDALPVATMASETFLGAAGYSLLAFAFMFSAMGAMNGSIMTNSRVPFAMARDGLFFKGLGVLHPKTETPIISLIVQAALSIILALSGTFDQLTDYVVFASWIFYALCTASLFVFRRKYPEAERTYKAFGYPILPLFFVATTIWLLINTLINSPIPSLIGLAIIAAGAPAYWYMKKSKQNTAQLE